MFVWYNSGDTLGRGRGAGTMGEHDGHRKRLRERFLLGGEDALTDRELLELLLFYAVPRRDTAPIAQALLEHFGSLQGTLSAPAAELEKLPGMGRGAAALIKLAPSLHRRARLSAASEQVLDTTERIGAHFLELLAGQRREVMYQLCLDAKGRRLHTYKLAEGESAAAAVNVRRIVENALFSGAVLVALAHNHPSGVAFPSPEDRQATSQVRTALESVGVRLVEHIIVADDDYISMRQQGLI